MSTETITLAPSVTFTKDVLDAAWKDAQGVSNAAQSRLEIAMFNAFTARANEVRIVAHLAQLPEYASTRKDTPINTAAFSRDYMAKPGESEDAARKRATRYIAGVKAVMADSALVAELATLDSVLTPEFVDAANTAWAKESVGSINRRAKKNKEDRVDNVGQSDEMGSESTTDEPNASIPTVLKDSEGVSAEALIEVLKSALRLSQELGARGISLSDDQQVTVMELAAEIAGVSQGE